MQPYRSWIVTAGIAAAAIAVTFGFTSAAQQQQPQDEAQVLTRGPVHEAFANATQAASTPNEIIHRGPPDPIEELPPDQKPEGENVAWIPGYWSWDEEREDFIWISGVWRDLPPNREWVPGYWTEVKGGYQFVSGFWKDTARQEVNYLPPPPKTLEVGPSTSPPAPNYTWAPGSWVWVDRSYAWQPGYWVVEQPNWVWTPAHYVWTPRGYVFVPGYWDYDIQSRGVMFAPVYYAQPVYRRPAYYYSPAVVVDVSIAIGHFFVHEHSCNYYYGDYYDVHYRRGGYRPWFEPYERPSRRVYVVEDPIFVHYRAEQVRRDPKWEVNIQINYRDRRDHPESRPPRTYVEAQAVVAKPRATGGAAPAAPAAPIARPLTQVAASGQAGAQHFQTIDAARRRELQTQAKDVQAFGGERRQLETKTAAAPASGAVQQKLTPPATGPEKTQPTPSRGRTAVPGRAQTQERGSTAAPGQKPDRGQTPAPSQTPARGRTAVPGQTQAPERGRVERTKPESATPTPAPAQTPGPRPRTERTPVPSQTPAANQGGRPQDRDPRGQVTQPPARGREPVKAEPAKPKGDTGVIGPKRNAPQTPPAQPEQEKLRPSPVVAKPVDPSKTVKHAPPAPDVPKPGVQAGADAGRARRDQGRLRTQTPGAVPPADAGKKNREAPEEKRRE